MSEISPHYILSIHNTNININTTTIRAYSQSIANTRVLKYGLA